MTRRPLWRALALLAWLCAAVAPVWPLTPLTSLRAVPDIAVPFNSTVIDPQHVAVDEFTGDFGTRSLGEIPAGVQIIAYALLPNGDELFAVDTSCALGELRIGPGDVVRRSGGDLSLLFEAAAIGALGLIPGTRIDAIAVIEGDLVLSFDISTVLRDSDALIVAEDEDLVRITASGSAILFFDGSDAGIDPALDLDAAQRLPDGHLLLSFDGSGVAGTVSFDDEDVLEFDPQSKTWELAYDGSNTAFGQLRDADLTSVFGVIDMPATPTATRTATATRTSPTTASPTASASRTVTSPAITGTATRTGTASRTPTAAPPTLTAPPNATPSDTPSRTATGGATRTVTPTGMPSSTVTATALISVTPTDTPAPGTPTATSIAAPCSGDCNGNGRVAINELVSIVNIALGQAPLSSCPSADRDRSGSVAISEIVTAVNQALEGCPVL